MLNLLSFKVTKKTSETIRSYVYTYRETLSNEMKLFYSDVAAMIDREVRKKAGTPGKITDMAVILERAYNLEKYVLAAGAASYEVQFQ